MAEAIDREGFSPDGGRFISFVFLLAALEALAIGIGYFNTGGFCFLCFGSGKLTVPWGGSVGNVTIDCPSCGGDGHMFA